jgi:CO/xanthine dehydrogenase Mo-binding subunit
MAIPEAADIHSLLKHPAVAPLPDQQQRHAGQRCRHTFSRRVTKQYLMHGSIGPSCAVAWFKERTLTVWTHTQGVYPLRAGIAEMLHLPPERVRCIHTEGSGCYGHNGADDAAADAGADRHANTRHGGRVQWMREQENLWEPLQFGHGERSRRGHHAGPTAGLDLTSYGQPRTTSESSMPVAVAGTPAGTALRLGALGAHCPSPKVTAIAMRCRFMISPRRGST